MTQRLDILLFGASGFTGRYVAPELYNLTKSNGRSLTWGIAGRSEEKLRQVLTDFGKSIDEDLSNIPIITADVNNDESLRKMTASARLLINCCGPFRLYGEQVVKACVDTSTHHVDVSGEPQYMESMQLNYHEAAKAKGVYIVSACGLDSIPADLGLVFLQQNFEGTLNSVETYLASDIESGTDTSGASLNYGTWESAVHSLHHKDELPVLRRKLFPKRLPNFRPKLQLRGAVHKNTDVGDKWSVPFPGSDRSVVLRTQRYLYEVEKKRPVQVQTYLVVGSFLNVIGLAIFGLVFTMFTYFKFTADFLLKHPKLFSFGMFSREGPSEEKMKHTVFSVTLRGEGWPERLSDPDQEFEVPPTKVIIGKVSGRNPGYGATCTALALSAIVILSETDKLPSKGGCYPPGAAFAKTTLIKQLQDNGMSFEILSKP